MDKAKLHAVTARQLELARKLYDTPAHRAARARGAEWMRLADVLLKGRHVPWGRK